MFDIKSQKVTKCQIGGHGNLDEIWRLPRFPLTEMFGSFDPNFPSFDQSLMIDTESGHVQLKISCLQNFYIAPLTTVIVPPNRQRDCATR